MTPFLPAIQALEKAGVRYVVVGGIAAIAHGVSRLTQDVDFVVELNPENARKAMEQMGALGLKPKVPVDPLDFADEQKRTEWISEKNMIVFSFYDPANPFLCIDFFVKHPINFDRLYQESILSAVDGVPVRVCGIDHLLEMKKNAGRPKDLEDIRWLTLIKERRHG